MTRFARKVLAEMQAMDREVGALDIINRLEGETPRMFGVSVAAVFNAIDELEASGYVTTRRIPGGIERNYRSRLMATLTDAGKRPGPVPPSLWERLLNLWKSLRD